MLESDFLGFINDNKLFGPTDRVLLAVSGGLDSMAMVDLFHRVGQPFAMAHVNFGLRGADSDADALFVQNKAREYGVPFHLTDVDTAAVAAERGLSIQLMARELRYDWFIQLLHDHRYACVATAHHLNDVLETVLFNLTRGTGLAGLHGIPVWQDRRTADGRLSGVLIRPLLFATREHLAHYVQTRGLTYREDRSNAEDKYARNRIRHHVVPVLTGLNPGVWQTLPRTLERLRAAETLVRAELDRSWQAIAEPQGDRLFLPTDKLLAQSELRFRLAEWLKPFGFVASQVDQLLDALAHPAGQVFLSATHRLIHDRWGLLLEPLPSPVDFAITLTDWPDADMAVAGTFLLRLERAEKDEAFELPADPAIACLDADRLAFPLTIRPWRQGDRFQPLGLKGRKLVSNLLNDLKLNRSEREQITVLLSGDQIVWVIGHRVAHPFRVTAETKRVVKIACLPLKPYE